MELIRELLSEQEQSFETRQGPEGEQFRINDHQGFIRFIGELGFETSKEFEQYTGLTADDLIEIDWFEYINDRVFPVDSDTGQVNWDGVSQE